jgi:hypothetical protein
VGENGMISKIEADDLAEKMMEFSANKYFEKMNSAMASYQFQDNLNDKYKQILQNELYT